MTNDERIDKMLNAMSDHRPCKFLDFCDSVFEEEDNIENTLRNETLRDGMWKDLGLITPINIDDDKFKITLRGDTIVKENDGWLKYVELNKKKNRIEENKIEWESELSEWNVKTRWWPHIITGFGLVISIIALVVSLQKSPTEERLFDILQEQQILQRHGHPTNQPTKDTSKNILLDSLKK